MNILLSIAHGIDKIILLSGRLISWLVVVLIMVVSYDVMMRYLFNSGSIALQELEWHLFAMIFLLGAAYTMQENQHVRLDLYYQSRFVTDYQRNIIDFIGTLVFLLPFCLIIIVSSWDYVMISYHSHEASPDPGGLTHRWLLKAMIPLGFLLLFIQGIANLIHLLNQLLKR